MPRAQGFVWLMLGFFGACTNAAYHGGNEGPTLSMPAHFGEGKNKPEEAPIADAGADGRELVGAGANEPAQPDPAALRLARQFEYSIVYERGAVRVESVRAVRFPKPVVTARKMGRFAIELWIGHELVERVRFDFPLVAAEDSPTRQKTSIARTTIVCGGRRRDPDGAGPGK